MQVPAGKEELFATVKSYVAALETLAMKLDKVKGAEKMNETQAKLIDEASGSDPQKAEQLRTLLGVQTEQGE